MSNEVGEKISDKFNKIIEIQTEADSEMELVADSIKNELEDRLKENIKEIEVVEDVKFKVIRPRDTPYPQIEIGIVPLSEKDNPGKYVNDKLLEKDNLICYIVDKYPVLNNTGIKLRINPPHNRLRRPYMRKISSRHSIEGCTKDTKKED